ncbi:hypothetical protein SLNWT_3441 [Streptomyces albus]|uniref:Uncharacterized protein n=1 Tax=Streptomyces albus (strain ATCC 21838 / DSM 41398 / FERM P-419 / JCM 4703 / NBRC 107858) TaxID=1081613 RepID=A0A0B5F0J5_STRA4|nr:hypothetical protein SLNWT_3441 [Streptomyces albus]AOU78122.1 hypothetical protein SLNHY_3431 [Streptomyces albus]AYN33877.1 hypothetical protein DUI70_3376 [Streptomyces albus]
MAVAPILAPGADALEEGPETGEKKHPGAGGRERARHARSVPGPHPKEADRLGRQLPCGESRWNRKGPRNDSSLPCCAIPQQGTTARTSGRSIRTHRPLLPLRYS